ncbi:MAG: Helix-turn-helix domain [Actinomycetota bacterium]|nr:Helix-turn-helix domain [Actinomycetota bacterium]
MIDHRRLRHLRTDRGLSQRKLAAAAGVDPLTITRLERGADMRDLPLRVLGNIATALGVPTADLLTSSPQRIDQPTELATTLGTLLSAAGPRRVSTCALVRATTATSTPSRPGSRPSPRTSPGPASPSLGTGATCGSHHATTTVPRPWTTRPWMSTRHDSSAGSTAARTSAGSSPRSNGR